MNLFLKYGLFVLFISYAFAQSDYRALHFNALVVDTHTDVLLQVNRGADISKRLDYGQVDLVRLKEGGVDVQVFAIWPNPERKEQTSMYEQSVYFLDLFDRIMAGNRDKIMPARSTEEIMAIVGKGKTAALLGLEGGIAIDNDLNKLKEFYDRGVRYLSLTWNESCDWASCAKDETSPDYTGHRGLTDFGREVILELNRLGMIVDLSHSGEKTFWDVINTTSKPVIASHSCAYELCIHYRNLKDDQIKAIGKNGGVIFLNFYPGYLKNGFDTQYTAIREESKAYLDSVKQAYGENYLGYLGFRAKYFIEKTASFRPDLTRLVDHMDHIIAVAGDDHVGLGSDFDGISIAPRGLDDVSAMPELTRVMLTRGYSEERIRKILGGNFMRVFGEVSN